jgi:hypothetical protein
LEADFFFIGWISGWVMGLVEACDVHQDGFNVDSCFYLNPQEHVNIILSVRCAARLCRNRLGGPLQRQSNVPRLTSTAASVAIIQFLQPAPEKD